MNQKKKSFLRGTWDGMNKIYRILVVIVFFVGAYFLKDPVKRLFMPDKEKNKEDHYDEGKLESKEIKGVIVYSNQFSENDVINLKLGSNSLHDITYLQIENGINLNEYFHFCDDPDIKIGLKIMNRRLYMSTRMEDLSSEFVGEIRNNYWDFYKDSQAELIQDNDSVLRFTDLSHDNLIDLKFINANTISLEGYFMGSDSVLVLNHTQKCYSLKNQKEEARKAIKEIK